MLLRRLLLVVAVLMALTAVTVALSSGTRDSSGTTGTAPSPPRQAAPAGEGLAPSEREGQAPGDSPLQTLRAEASDQVVRLRPGDRLRLRVTSDALESVQLGVDGPIEAVDPESPAEFEILAEPGFDAPVMLLESGRTIGRVTTQR